MVETKGNAALHEISVRVERTDMMTVPMEVVRAQATLPLDGIARVAEAIAITALVQNLLDPGSRSYPQEFPFQLREEKSR